MHEILKNRVTGFFKARIISINPDKEKLEQIMGEETEEPSYSYTKRDGTECMRLDFYLENVSGGELFLHQIYLESVDEVFKSGATRYINQVGETQITTSEDKLFESMKEFQKWDNDERKFVSTGEPKEVRIAKKGEYELMALYLLAHPNIDLKGNNFLDIEAIIKGDLSLIDLPLDIPAFAAFAYVDNNEENGYKQRIFKELIPIRDISDYLANSPSKYTARKFKKWHDDFDYIKDETIYNFGRLEVIKEEFIPKSKEFTDGDSEY